MAKTIDTRRHRAALPVFTPSAVAPESLASRTVGREAEVERLVRAIRTAAMTDNRPHQLIVGPRGSGKTHLLIVALHEALGAAETADRVAVAMLPEDAVEIAGYEDLLVSVVDRAPGASDERREQARTLRSRHDVAGLERLTLQQLGDRVLILVVENLDRVFRDLGDQGQARLRNLTETSAKVLLVASTPLLFDAVSDHARPWYGSFEVEHLGELDAEHGRELLRRIAATAGDDKLAASLDTPTGLARVRAVEHLAGGSPRMWTVLAGCMTVELLDELVPLVEALFDELAPYYQQRLWDLAGVERKLVHELCRTPAATVKDLAHAAGLTQRAAATSLGRLHDACWLRREKRRGTDQRSTWYSLREPLLRHHVEYRESGRLPALVSFLRDFFEVEELARQLAEVEPGSLAEAYLLMALSGGGGGAARTGAYPSFASREEMLAAARCWIAMPRADGIGSFAVGVVTEAVVSAVSIDSKAGRRRCIAQLAGARGDDASALRTVVDAALSAMSEEPPTTSWSWRCQVALFAASRAEWLSLRDQLAVGLVACGLGMTKRSRKWLEHHRYALDVLDDGEERLRLIFAGMSLARNGGQGVDALATATALVAQCEQRFGASDRTTLGVIESAVVGVAMSGELDGLEHFAARATQIAGRADALRELCIHVMRTGLKMRFAKQPSVDAWLDTWGDALGDRGSGDFRRLMDLVRFVGDPERARLPEWELQDIVELFIERGSLGYAY